MRIQSQVHSTTKRAAAIILVTACAATAILTTKRPNSSKSEELTLQAEKQAPLLIAPIITLPVHNLSKETSWSEALAKQIDGKTEYTVQNGRVDVYTENYAIEVDRIEKWHEGIGQAAHYGLLTGKLPALAIILEDDKWPITKETELKLLLIEKIAISKGIKIIILRASGKT